MKILLKARKLPRVEFAELNSQLDSLKERPTAELFRREQQTLDKLRGTLRVFHHAHAGFQCRAHQPKSGIRNGWRARVGDKRDFLARPQPRDQLGHAMLLVMLVVADCRRTNLMTREHLPGAPRVLACDQADLAERANRARRNVVGISDRRRDYIQNSAGVGLFICALSHYNSD